MPPPALTPKRWQRIAGLVDVALELDRPLRAAWLESVTRQDLELRIQVVELLRRLGADMDDEPKTDSGDARRFELDPDRIGPYRLLRILGRGGMGVVHLAERADRAYERKVAIKIIGARHDAPIVQQRFLAERQILARFDHPNIAHLLEGGSTPDGRPYFVMELVDGPPIDRFCRERRLGLAQRLELFLKVCSATAYAHQRLVVHRDLKPSNVLVGPDGQPKLLDFGIAKLLDPASMPFPVEPTRLGSRPMTLGYAAPEQVLGEAVSTAADVFALGVLLYVLLTGRVPFDLRAGQSLDEQLAILRAPPTPPSVQLRQAKERPHDDAGWPGDDLGQLARRVAGDLDAIVAKALSYDATERYGAVADLIEDLQRHRRGRPVAAGSGTRLYRAGKFIRRYRLAVMATAIVVGSLFGFTFFTWHQGVILEQERVRAEGETRRASETRDFLVDTLRGAEAASKTDDHLHLQTLLDLAHQRLLAGAIQDAKVHADLLKVLTDGYWALKDYASTASTYETALKSAIDMPPSQRSQLHLGAGEALLTMGKVPAGRAHLERSLALVGIQAQDRIRARYLLLIAAFHEGPLPSLFDRGHDFFSELEAAGSAREAIPDFLFDALEYWSATVCDIGYAEESISHVRRAAAAARARGRSATPFLARETLILTRSAEPARALQGFRYLFDELGHGNDRAYAEALVARIAFVETEINHGSLESSELQLAKVHENIDRILAFKRPDARSDFYRSSELLLQAQLLEHSGKKAQALEAYRESSALATAIARSTPSINTKSLAARALLLAGRAEEARPLVAELIGSGFRPASFVALAESRGALPSPMPPQPPLPKLPAWVEAWLPAEGDVPPWEQK